MGGRINIKPYIIVCTFIAFIALGFDMSNEPYWAVIKPIFENIEKNNYTLLGILMSMNGMAVAIIIYLLGRFDTTTGGISFQEMFSSMFQTLSVFDYMKLIMISTGYHEKQCNQEIETQNSNRTGRL